MRADDPSRRRALRALRAGCAGCAAAIVLAWGGARAIDNPDAPDLTAAFQARAKPLEARWTADAGGPHEAAAARAYARFLDAELNLAYQALLKRLTGEPRRALVRSQRQWLAFRDAEARFITGNWTRQAFGSSATLSRAEYQSGLVRQRVLGLLAYLQNYPPD